MATHAELADIAADVLAHNRYAVLATADEAGRPWASPVWFAPVGIESFLWVSRATATHSRNIAVRPELSLVVFDSTQDAGTGLAVYARAQARVVPDDEVDLAIEPYSARSEADGMGRWDAVRLTAGGLRLYRAEVTELSILPGEGTDDRIVLGL